MPVNIQRVSSARVSLTGRLKVEGTAEHKLHCPTSAAPLLQPYVHTYLDPETSINWLYNKFLHNIHSISFSLHFSLLAVILTYKHMHTYNTNTLQATTTDEGNRVPNFYKKNTLA